MTLTHNVFQPFVKSLHFNSEDGDFLNVIPDEHIIVLNSTDDYGKEFTQFIGTVDAFSTFKLVPYCTYDIEFYLPSQFCAKFNLSPADFINGIHNMPDTIYVHQHLPGSDFEKICNKIRKCFGCISINDISNEFGYSPRHISRLFNSNLGYSAKTYCKMIRFHYALQEMQKEPDEEISWFIQNLNYSDQAHFQREFKSFMEMTPHQYINQLRHHS